jgi:hypothetical protein
MHNDTITEQFALPNESFEEALHIANLVCHLMYTGCKLSEQSMWCAGYTTPLSITCYQILQGQAKLMNS